MNGISDEIKKISDIITRNYQVEKIFLFGSYARGDENNDSNIDICILINNNHKKLKIIRTIRKAFYDNISSPVDLLVYKPDEFYERAASLKSIEREIKEEGVLLYG
jgi:uncharacterized protein